jgi:8-oxo-dGTP pyrophosphatase MutT (NUDIX family)
VGAEEIQGEDKAISLPFQRVSARALIVRARDGAILGTLHRQEGRYALPGGLVEDGESSLQAILRELAEEHIELVGEGSAAGEGFVVDYFEGYQELSIWHVFRVEDAHIGASHENVESRWVGQDEDIWYPGIRERLIMAVRDHFEDLAHVEIHVA